MKKNTKEDAITLHSKQAGKFASNYELQPTNALSNCFNYSRRRLDILLEGCFPIEGRGFRLLDVGCGTGHHMMRFCQRGFDVSAIDGSEKMLSYARANNPGTEILQADVEKIPFPDDSFDFVLCVEVLRYLPSYSKCIQEMARVLKPRGVCIATATPLFSLNGYWLVNRIASLWHVGDLVRLRQNFSTSWGLRREFRHAGFDAPEIHGVYFGPINWVERLLPGILPWFLKAWEPLDASLADLPVLREFTNMFLVKTVKK